MPDTFLNKVDDHDRKWGGATGNPLTRANHSSLLEQTGIPANNGYTYKQEPLQRAVWDLIEHNLS